MSRNSSRCRSVWSFWYLQVSISYSKEKAQPGESVNVRVTAAADSLVGLLAVDQSVLLLAGGNDITQADVSPVVLYWKRYVF